ncbi:M48 family metalloprotease [Rhodocytophaga rosea]|uniref:M48 family metalloprotease n=1 Tax=Rhodocytophaga rosea TaxID=2704465 RepID=A0A6C0GLF7_9BACT|nr:M56 family metallopeptidase [Rhodocytophaga rosea]QHT68462.1 M48 family metalloprotease [Rhodocytophaga rosea]
MNTLSSIAPDKWIQALGWTLLHSLWQGLIAAVLLGILLLLLHRQSATIRYFVSTLTLFTFLLVTVATFVKEYSILTKTTASEATPMNYAIGFPVALTTSQPASQAETLSPGFYSTFSVYFTQHLPSIVLLWALGIMVLLLRFMGGLAYSQRLKHYKIIDLPEYWQNCVKNLSERAQIRQTVRLVESALVKVPVVIGYFKPVILLPVGTILGLPSEQIEAILAHELAHISRKDYLVNIGQCLVEILFFFHPAVWWMSSRIREEREHCCDDMALALCGDSLTFAKALANLQGVHTGTASLALGFAGKGQSLLHRIQRLIGQPRRNPNFMEGFLAACFLMASIMAVSVSAGTALQTTTRNLSLNIEELPAEEKSYLPEQTLVSDSLKNKGTFTYKGSKNGRKYDVKATIENDKITKLYLDGKKVPVAEIEKYQDLVYELMADVPNPPVPPVPMSALAPVAPYTYEDDWDLEPAIAPIEPFEPLEPMEPMEPLAPIEPVAIADVLEEALTNDTTRLKNYKGNFTIVHQGKDKKEYTFRMKDGVLEELEIDNKPVPKSEYKNYSFIVDEIRQDAELRRAEAMLRQEEARERQLESRYRMEEARERMYEERRALQGRIAGDRERAIHKNGELSLQQRRAHERVMQDQQRVMREHERALQRQGEQMRNQQRALEQHTRAMKDHEKSLRRHEFSLELREELKKDKLIKNENSYTFKLDSKGLYIDGEKQPEAVYEKYKKMAEKEHGSITGDFKMEFQYKNDDK